MSIPYLLGYALQGSGLKFTGCVFAVAECNSYIADMLTGASGAWLFRTPYTIFPQSGVLAYLPYILIGKLTSPPGIHEQLLALFHIYRLAATIFSIVATYYFVSEFIQSIYLRRLGTVLIVFGGGLGWLLISIGKTEWLGSIPLEFYSPERFGFLELFGLPHLAVARACLLLGLRKYIRGKSSRSGIQAGIWLVLSSFFQPLTTGSGWVILIAHVVISAIWIQWIVPKSPDLTEQKTLCRSYFAYAKTAMIISSPVIMVTAYFSIVDPFMRGWNALSEVFSPNILHYFSAYLLVLPLAFIGARAMLRSDFFKATLLIGWLVIFPILAYLPHNSQRRVPEGVWVVLIILGLNALVGFIQRYRKTQRLIPFAVTPFFLSTGMIFIGSMMTVSSPSLPQYRTDKEIRSYAFFNNQSDGNSVVLASDETSNALPAWAPVQVISGLSVLNIGDDQIKPKINEFYSGMMSGKDQKLFLEEMQISHIYLGPYERKLGRWGPDKLKNYKLVYDRDDIQIYQLNNPNKN
jgi:hypothetical protein